MTPQSDRTLAAPPTRSLISYLVRKGKQTSERHLASTGNPLMFAKSFAKFIAISALLLASAGTPTLTRAQTPQEKEALAEAERLNKDGIALHQAGKYSEAEPLFRRALEIRQKTLGPEHPGVAAVLSNLGLLYNNQGQYAKAEPPYQQALTILEKALGPEHPAVATSLDNLAGLYQDQGQYARAEPLFQRALAIREKPLGPEHLGVALSLNNLAALYQLQGQFLRAESLYQRSQAITEKVLGMEHPAVAKSLNNLAALYQDQGQYARAEPLYQRSLAIKEKVLGPDHPDVAISLDNLAGLYRQQDHYTRAEPLFQRALAIREKALGPEHPDVAQTLNNLALLLAVQGQYGRAEPLVQRSLAIREKALGTEHPDVAQSLNNLAAFYGAQGQYARAEPLYQRSLALYEKFLGTEHFDVATSLANLAFLHQKKGTLVSARPFYERSRQVRLASTRSNADVDEDALRGLAMEGGRALLDYAGLLATIARDPKLDDKPGSAWRDAFVVLEQARSGLAQSALAKTSARVASGDPAVSTLARDVQDLRNRRQALTKRLDAEYGKPTAQRDQELFSNLQLQRQKLDNELKSAVNRLNRAFPKYAELASPEPITLVSADKLLYPDEALISYFALDDRLLLWLVRKGKEVIYRDIEIKKEELKKLVTSVRESLDQSKNTDFAKFGNLVPFDVSAAHELYKRLISPLRDHLSGVNQLIIVPDEVLLPLPFAALVTSNEAESFKGLFELQRQGLKLNPRDQQLLQYSKLPWLLKDYGLTVLPSATSLRALREIPRTKPKETELLIAFGDPVLDGKGAIRGGAMLASRGSFIPVDEIRKMNRLPGSRGELQAIAKALGASSDSIFLDEQATETAVAKRNLSGRLAKAEVVAFSTHGLMSGELKGLKEPALVLTPPKTSSEEDDGLLGLEDILRLKLDSADWVILSACNTGAADGSGEGLSGLARAFFFAGAKTLLVSHWSVEDRATQTLMTEIFQRYAKDKTLPRAEAVRQGMLSLMNGARSSTAYFAHPFAWAPFFIVGD